MYLAAREVGVKLPAGEWWEVFDVEREELGFLVVGMGSLEGWVGSWWEGRGRVPLTVEEVEVEMGRVEEDERGWGGGLEVEGAGGGN